MVTGVTLAWAAFASAMNKRTGGNYMFVADHPRGWSPLQLFGRWPWYLVVVGPGVIGAFALLTVVWKLPADR